MYIVRCSTCGCMLHASPLIPIAVLQGTTNHIQKAERVNQFAESLSLVTIFEVKLEMGVKLFPLKHTPIMKKKKTVKIHVQTGGQCWLGSSYLQNHRRYVQVLTVFREQA